jgi:auxin efflux carrier family protein
MTDFLGALQPTGPPAMKLITLVQISDAEEEDERNIAKLLTVSPSTWPADKDLIHGGLSAWMIWLTLP